MTNEINLVSVFKLLKKNLVWILLVGLLFSLCLPFYYKYFENKQNPTVNSAILILPESNAFSNDVDTMNLQLAMFDKSLKNIYEMSRSEKIIRKSILDAGVGQQIVKTWDNDVQIRFIGESGLLEISIQLDSINQSTLLANALMNNIQQEIQQNFPIVKSSVFSSATTDLFKTVQNEVSKMQLIIAFLIGTIIMCILIYFMDYFNNKIKTEKQLEEITKNKVIYTIRKKMEAESAQIIHTILQNMNSTENYKSYLFISINEDPSKTRLIQNIAKNLASINKKVLLIDADMRNQSLSKKMALKDKIGLFDAINTKIDDLEMIIINKFKGLDVLPAGRPILKIIVSDLLSSAYFKELIKNLSSQYDYILINSNSFYNFVDSAIISTIVDANIITVQQDKIAINKMVDATRTLEKLNSTITGMVFTDTF